MYYSSWLGGAHDWFAHDARNLRDELVHVELSAASREVHETNFAKDRPLCPRIVVQTNDRPGTPDIAVRVAAVQLVLVVQRNAARESCLGARRPLRVGRVSVVSVARRLSVASTCQRTSSIFFAQYILRKPCIFPVTTICSCAAFHSASCVVPSSSSVSEYV